MDDSLLSTLLRYLDYVLTSVRLPASLAGASGGLSTTDWTTLISGFGGALIGGGIGAAAAYATAKQAAREARERDLATREDAEMTAALKMMSKASDIANSIETIIGHIVHGVRRGHPIGMPVERIWSYVQPTTPFSRPPIQFQVEDFIFLMKGRYGDLIHGANLMATRVASIEAAFDAYIELRIAMQTFLDDYTRYDPALDAMITEVPEALKEKARIRSIELDNLLKGILRSSYEQKDVAAQMCSALNVAAKARFGDRFPFTLSTA